MTRRRFIADEVSGKTAAITGDHANHLARVLRAKVGQQFDIATGASQRGVNRRTELRTEARPEVRRGTITSISDDRVEFAFEDDLESDDVGHEPVLQSATQTAPNITLALAIFKFDRMEWAIEKCTELGVTRIIPVIARRSDAHLAHAAAKRHDRWLRLVRQASEQSRRPAAPEMAAPLKLKDLAAALPATATRIVLAESLAGSSEEETNRLQDILRSHPAEVALAIGPEGGWTTDELAWFRAAGWLAASLGNTILRSETAAIVATALAIDAMHRLPKP
jgi:16S rRNA (uracil1498-N3)-methyltransferase